MFSEIREVRFRSVKRVAILDFGLGMRARKGEKLIRDDPVEVAVFHSLVVLVFFHVKGREIDEVVLESLFESVEAIEQTEIVCAHAK